MKSSKHSITQVFIDYPSRYHRRYLHQGNPLQIKIDTGNLLLWSSQRINFTCSSELLNEHCLPCTSSCLGLCYKLMIRHHFPRRGTHWVLIHGCYNQNQKCWDTPTKKRPFLPQIAPGHRSVRYHTDLPPPPSHSKLFLQVLSMVLYC